MSTASKKSKPVAPDTAIHPAEVIVGNGEDGNARIHRVLSMPDMPIAEEPPEVKYPKHPRYRAIKGNSVDVDGVRVSREEGETQGAFVRRARALMQKAAAAHAANLTGADAKPSWTPPDDGIMRDRIGKPTMMTAHTLAKLELAFRAGAKVNIACGFAGVSRTVYERFVKKYPEYKELVGAWQKEPVAGAWICLAREAKTNPQIAELYLRLLGETKDNAVSFSLPGEFDFVAIARSRSRKYEELVPGELDPNASKATNMFNARLIGRPPKNPRVEDGPTIIEEGEIIDDEI